MTEQAATPAATETAVPVTPDASLMAAAPAPAAEPAAPAAPVRPDGLPDAYWDDATGIKPEAFAKLAELEAVASDVPATAADYKLDLPEDVVGLDGQPVRIDADDPLAQAILPALHEAKIGQAAVSKIVQAYAAAEVSAAKAEAEAAKAWREAETAKLGKEHEKRTAALHGQVIAAVGPEGAEALRAQMRSADAILALETLVSKIQAPSMSAAPLTPPSPRSVTERLYGSN